MKDLNVYRLYEKNDEQVVNDFFNNVNSNFKLNIDIKNVVMDTEWIDVIDNTIQYIDNILRSPNRFIIDDDEVVKIELARKITAESIKHLARNTNLIQDYNVKTDEIKPSKILNINKEESYDTYENRVIYTLIQNIKIFIIKKKQYINEVLDAKKCENKVLEYYSKSEVLGDKVEIKLQLNANLDDTAKLKLKIDDIFKKIEELENKMNDITSLEVYKIIEKKHITLVTPPIRKTNLILKNTNFQYAMKLWNYLQDNIENKSNKIEEKKDFSNDENTEELLNETFLLNYLTIRKLRNSNEENEKVEEKTREKLTNELIEKLLELNSDLTQEELLKMIGAKYNSIVERVSANFEDIRNIFEEHMDKYLERIEE